MRLACRSKTHGICLATGRRGGLRVLEIESNLRRARRAIRKTILAYKSLGFSRNGDFRPARCVRTYVHGLNAAVRAWAAHAPPKCAYPPRCASNRLNRRFFPGSISGNVSRCRFNQNMNFKQAEVICLTSPIFDWHGINQNHGVMVGSFGR